MPKCEENSQFKVPLLRKQNKEEFELTISLLLTQEVTGLTAYKCEKHILNLSLPKHKLQTMKGKNQKQYMSIATQSSTIGLGE